MCFGCSQANWHHHSGWKLNRAQLRFGARECRGSLKVELNTSKLIVFKGSRRHPHLLAVLDAKLSEDGLVEIAQARLSWKNRAAKRFRTWT